MFFRKALRIRNLAFERLPRDQDPDIESWEPSLL